MTAELQTFAYKLHGWGANVTAIKAGTKRPGHNWQGWQSERQTVDELERLPWSRAAAVGVVNGSGNFRFFDFDAPKDEKGRPLYPVPESVLETALRAIGLLPDYQWSFASGSGAGWGFVVRCEETLPEDWTAEKGVYRFLPKEGFQFDHLELRWSSGQTVIMGKHPTGPGYRWRLGKPPFKPPALVTAERVVNAVLAVGFPEIRETAVSLPTIQPLPNNGISAYGQGALQDAISQISTTPNGNRNNMLFQQTAGLVELVNGGELARLDVESGMMQAALTAGLPEGEARATIESAIKTVGDKARVAPSKSVGINGGWVLETADESQPGMINPLNYRCEDGGILDAWLEFFGPSWIYVTGQERWYFWTKTHWEPDNTQQIKKEVQHLLERLNSIVREQMKAAREDENKKLFQNYITATKRTKNRVSSIEGMAQAERAIPAGGINSGNCLNLLNGLLDLETVSFGPHHPEDLQTYCLPYEYDPTADCPRWEQFIKEVLISEITSQHDEKMAALFQELFGYSLTIETQHETMPFLWGGGANGKSVAIGILKALLGPLATKVDFRSLGQSGNYDLAKIRGKRVIFNNESERGGRVAESWLKQIVSGELINGRPIYGQPIDFFSISKIWWSMNDRPNIQDSSDGIWRRLKLIPFNRTFSKVEQDIELGEKLKAELPGILNWALVGLERLRENGRFTEVQSVTIATNEYKKESNPVLLWKDERTILLPEEKTPASDLHKDFQQWAQANGCKPMNRTFFGRELTRLEGVKKSSRLVLYNLGILLDETTILRG